MSGSESPISGGSSTTDSTSSTPPAIRRIDAGNSLTLAQFIAQVEAEVDEAVDRVSVSFSRRSFYVMPVMPPNDANVDRFNGQGGQMVEDIAYTCANRTKLATSGIITFQVTFINMRGEPIEYRFYDA